MAAERRVPITDESSDDGMADAAHRLVERSTIAAGVPAQVEDPSVYARVASVVRAAVRESATRSAVVTPGQRKRSTRRTEADTQR